MNTGAKSEQSFQLGQSLVEFLHGIGNRVGTGQIHARDLQLLQRIVRATRGKEAQATMTAALGVLLGQAKAAAC